MKSVAVNASQHPGEHKVMEREQGVPVDQTQETAGLEQGGLAQNALSVAARLNPEVEHSLARQTHFGPQRDATILLEADDPPEIERLAVAEDIRMTAPPAQPRTTGESIEPATDDPERIGSMPATLAA